MIAPPLNFFLALVSLRMSWRRNLLAIGGLVLGVAAIVAILALTLVVRAEALRQFERTGLDVLAVRKTSGAGAQAGRMPPAIDLALAEGISEAVPAARRVAPVMTRRAAVGVGGRQVQMEHLGVTEAFLALNGLVAAEGRLLTELDRNEPHVVLGHEQAAAIRSSGDEVVGRQFTIEGKVLTVLGVLAPARAIRLHDGDLNKAVFLHAATFARVFAGSEIGTLYVQHETHADPARVASDVTDHLRRQVDGLTLDVTSAAALLAEMERQLRLFTLLFGALGSISLMLGGAGIMNGLLHAVAERRREIGLRRALGATQGDIVSQFMQEALMLSGLGGLVGMGMGVLIASTVASRAGWQFALPFGPLEAGVVVALTVGTVAGFFPAWQAARLDPVVAMRLDR